MKFTDLFVRRPVLALVVSLLILLIGLRAFFELPVRQYPELKNTVITVTTSYPGASAELMQGFITTPIAQVVASAEGIDYMTASSAQGQSTVKAFVRLNYDPNTAMTDVMAKVQQVKYQIPKEANDPVILKSTGDTTAVMYMGFSSPELTGPAITDYLTRVVQPLLATVPGVAQAEILGGQPFAMRVWLDPGRMAARGIAPGEVAAAIRANNFQSAPGQAKGYFTVVDIVADTGLKSLDEFRDMVVKAEDGGLVRLRDIATIELGAQSSSSSVSMNGQRAVFIGVNATPTGNPLEIVKGVREILPTIQRGLPPTVEAQVVYNSTRFIESSINEVERTLAEAVGIVIVVIFLFLGSFRSVLIPVVTIPLSIIGGCVLMLALGFSLNLLTLLAMVLAIGLVVDDAIVVVENVHRHIEEGLTPLQASLVGAREIAGPVIAMTITLAAVYAPIGFLTGLTGALFREFAFTLAGAVIISGIVALTLSPMMCSLILKGHGSQGRFANLIDRTFTRITGWYGRRLDHSLELPAGDGAVRGGGAGADRLPVHAHPVRAGAGGGPGHRVLAGQGAAIRQPRLCRRVRGPARPGVRVVPRDGHAVRHQRPGGWPDSGIAGMILKPWEDRTRSAQALNPLVQAELSKITGESVFAFSLPPLPGSTGGLPVQMVISSPAGYETVFKLMEELKAAARKSGLFIVTDSDLAFNNPVIRIQVDRAKANDLGITMASVGEALGTMVGGNYVNRFNLNGRSYEVIPQVPRADRLSAESLGQYHVKTLSGETVPLSTVVRIESGIAPNALTQYNQLNSATFSAVPMPGVSMGQAVAFLEQQAKELLPADFQHAFLSDSRQYVTEGNQLTITFAFALVVIFLVLAAQFEILARPVRDPGQRADVDLRRLAAAVLRAGHLEHLHPDRARDPDRPDQQARHLDGRVRQRPAAQPGPGPAPGDSAGGPGAAAADPDDDGRHGGGPVPAAGRGRCRGRQPLRDRAGHRVRHADRHAVHPVRAARRLHHAGGRPPPRHQCPADRGAGGGSDLGIGEGCR